MGLYILPEIAHFKNLHSPKILLLLDSYRFIRKQEYFNRDKSYLVREKGGTGFRQSGAEACHILP
jgi:hypothetical protein